ncbi:MAG: type II secretion system F family protein [Clostridia bacterium]
MTQYQYTVLSPSGKLKKGKIEAQSVEDARLRLKDDLLEPIKIKKINAASKDIHMPWKTKVNSNHMARFLRQFAAIYQTGLPMVSSLDLVRKQTSNKYLVTALYNVIQNIEKGASLSEALKKEPDIFGELVCEMVAVGEQSGTLIGVLDRLALYYEKIDNIKNATVKALIYPFIVVLLVAIVLVIMMTQIIPEFEAMFESAGSSLPWITTVVMGCCNFLSVHFIFLAFMFFAMFAGTFYFSKTIQGKYFFGKLSRKLPLIKQFTINQSSAMFSNTLSLLLYSGIPIVESLDICKTSLKNVYFKDAVDKVKEMIVQGHSLGLSITSVDIFPIILCQMVSIGEQSGQLSQMLEKTSKYYDDELEVSTERLLAALEPAIMLALSIFVGIIVFAIVLPMFTVYGTML